MSHISSINLQKSKDYQVFHNTNIRPNYAIGGELSYTLKGYEALKLKNQIIENAKEQYTKRTGQKFQAKSYEWSAVCNIKPNTTMQDLEKLAEHFNQKYGFQCYQIAIHRDEGHINEKGEKVINHHAHLEFITLDRQTGKNNYRRELITPKVLRQIQTEVAEILGMQRGQDKRLTGVKRIEPRKYAQMKENERKSNLELKKSFEIEKAKAISKTSENVEQQLKQNFLSPAEIKETLEAFRKQCIGKGYPKDFFRDLTALKQSKEPTTKELLNATLEDLAKGYEEAAEINQKIYKENKELKIEIYSLKNELNPLNTINIPQTYKTKLIDEAYTDLSRKIDLKPYFFDKEKKEFVNQKLDFKVQDKGNSINLNSKNSENMGEKVKLMLQMAIAKGWDLDKIEINGSSKFIAEVHKQISEIQKSKINSLESDLKAKEQKIDELVEKNKEMDLKGNSMLENDKNKVIISDDIIRACFWAVNGAFRNIYNLRIIVPAESNAQKQERIEIFESRLRALESVSKEKFAEWEKESNYKEILEKYKKEPIKIKQQTKQIGRGSQ